MRPDQLTRLAEVSERLAEVVILDADPDSWTATGKTLGDMSKEERGDAKWCRQTAVQSVALLVRVQQLLEPAAPLAPGQNDLPDPEAEISRAERVASDMLDRVGRREPAAHR